MELGVLTGCILIIIATIVVQNISNSLMWHTAKYLSSNYHQYNPSILLSVIIVIALLTLLVDIFIWALFLIFIGLFTNLTESLIFSFDNFTTLGALEPFESPWTYIGPLIALNGIVIVACAVSSAFYVAGSIKHPTESVSHI